MLYCEWCRKLNANKGGGPNGQCKHITYSVEMPLPYRFCFKVLEKYYVEKSEMIREKSQSKWDKTLVIRRYYVETIGNITDEAIQYI